MNQYPVAHRVIPILVFLVTISAGIVFGQDTRPLEVDDFFKFGSVQDPQPSPDGEWIAYLVRTSSLKDDKSENRIWMAPTGEGEAIPMTSKGYSASRPRWSPDGKFLAFTAAKDKGKTQVWTLDRRGGDSQQLTEVKQGISSFDWSPDGTRMVLVIKDEEAPEDTVKTKNPKPWVMDRLQFKQDRVGYLTGNRRNHLYVLDVESRKLTQITSGNHDEGSPIWSPDGSQVAFVSNRTEDPDTNPNSDIWIVSAANTDKGQTLRQVTTNPLMDTSPSWSPDGSAITYITRIDKEASWYATRHLAVVSLEGGGPRLLTTGIDRNVRSPQYSPDGRSIYFGLEDDREQQIARVDLSSGKVERLIKDSLTASNLRIEKSGRLTLLVGTLEIPSEVHVFENGTLRRVSHVNDELMGQIELSEVREIKYESKDGTEIEGFMYFPGGYDTSLRYPTLLRIHGGPVSQYAHSFRFDSHLFAANGYVVIQVNPRGSTGQGQDFSRAIFADWGNKDSEDVISAVEFAVEQGIADPDRLGVGGWSYGGMLTNYVIVRTGMFAGAISGASMAFGAAAYGTDHYQRIWEEEIGLPWENREGYERVSAINDVANITTPTLWMGGEKDWNVPTLNSESFYQSMRRLGIDTQLVVYPGQPHGIGVPSYQKDRFERYLSWYAKYVKGIELKSVEVKPADG